MDGQADAMEACFNQSAREAARCSTLQQQCGAVQQHLLQQMAQGAAGCQSRQASEGPDPEQDGTPQADAVGSSTEWQGRGRRSATVRSSQGRALAAAWPQTGQAERTAGPRHAPLTASLFDPAAAGDVLASRSPLQPLAANTACLQEQAQQAKPVSPSKGAGGDSPTLFLSALSGSHRASSQSPSPTRRRRGSVTRSPTPTSAAVEPAQSHRAQPPLPDVCVSTTSLGASTLSSAAAGPEAIPEHGDAMMVSNPLFTTADVSASAQLRAATDHDAQARASDDASQRTAPALWQPYPADTGSQAPQPAGSAAHEQDCEPPSSGAAPTAADAALSMWGPSSVASAAAPVSLVSSPHASAAGEQAQPSMGSGPGAPVEEGVSCLPTRHARGGCLTPAASDNPFDGAAAPCAAPDMESVNMPQRQPAAHDRVPQQAPAPSSCASNRPFFPPASRYAPAPTALLARKRGAATAASALPAQERMPAAAGQAAAPWQEDLPAKASALGVSAVTSANTVIEVPGAAPVSSDAERAWQASRPRQGTEAEGHQRQLPPVGAAWAQQERGQRLAQPAPAALLRPRPGPLAASSPAVLRASLNAQLSAAPPAVYAPLTSRSEPTRGGSSTAAAPHNKREPSTLEFLRSSGIFPAQGPLAASRDALLRSSAPQLPHAHAPEPASARADAGQNGGSNAGQPKASVAALARFQLREEDGAAKEPSSTPQKAGPRVPEVQPEEASPVLMQSLRPPPQHLRTPTLMFRAGDAQAYEEVEAFPGTPRDSPPAGPLPREPAAVADSVPQAPAPLGSGSSSSASQQQQQANGAGSAPARLPPLPPHLRTAFLPLRASLETLPLAPTAESAPPSATVSHPQQQPSSSPAPKAAAVPVPDSQQAAEQRPSGISADALEAGAMRLKPAQTGRGVAAVEASARQSHQGQPGAAAREDPAAGGAFEVTPAGLAEAASRLRPAAKADNSRKDLEEHDQTEPEEEQPKDARGALLDAIKAGAFTLRKAPPPGTTAGNREVQGGEQGSESPPEAPTNGVEAIMQRAQAMRASAYPDSTVNGSDTSRWND